MKRGKFYSEYDRVRKTANYAKPQYEFDEEPAPNQNRVQAAHDDFKERMAAFNAADAAAAAAGRARATALSQRANLSVLTTEFARAGVTPPCVNDAGDPTVSLPMLLWLGWTIVETEDGRFLQRPAPDRSRTAPHAR